MDKKLGETLGQKNRCSMDFCTYLEANKCKANLAFYHLSLFQKK